MEATTIMELAGDIGGLGALLLIAWHTFTRTIPGFAKAIAEQQAKHDKEVSDSRAEFIQALKDVKESSKSDIHELADVVGKLADQVERNTRVLLGVSVRGLASDDDASTTTTLATQAGMPRDAVESALRQAIKRARDAPDSTQTIVLATLREALANAAKTKV